MGKEKIIKEQSLTAYKHDNNFQTIYQRPIYKKDSDEIIGVEEIPISNSWVEVSKIRCVDNGIESNEFIAVIVKRKNFTSKEILITLKDLLGQNPTLKLGPATRIYLGKGFTSYFREAIQMQCETAPYEVTHRHLGWINDNGKMVFLNRGLSVTEKGLVDKYIVDMGSDEAYNDFKHYGFVNTKHDSRYKTLLEELPKMACKSLIYAGLGYTFLTPLNKLLQGLGCEPQFILYVAGKTGVYKSSISKVFLSFFGHWSWSDNAPMRFKDTPNDIEMKMALVDSGLVLLDDRIPSTTKSIKDQMERVEQNVFRGIGDRAGRGRLGADGTPRPTYRPVCNLIVTSEEVYSNVGESAVARAITCALKNGDVDFEALKKVQDKEDELNECMAEYIQYVIVNWDRLSNGLKAQFDEYKMKAQNGGHARLSTSVAHLQIGIATMCDWLLCAKVITKKQSEALQKEAWDIFLKLSAEQNSRIYEEKPVTLFLNAMKELINKGDIKFIDLTMQDSWKPLKPIGYKDEYYFYCYPDTLYAEIREFYLKQDLNFPLSKKALFQQLQVDGLIETDKGQTTKLKRIENKQARFLWLRASALEEKEDTEIE